jgi:2-oxoglutarate ferredoxin oxidoreductase subunit beta
MLAAGATFVARGYSVKADLLADLIVQGVKHKGFAFIDVLQPCFTFFNTFKFYNNKVYELEGHDPSNLEAARTRAREWNYDMEAEKIPIGLFYKVERPSYDEQVLRGLVLAQERDRSDIPAFIRSHM